MMLSIFPLTASMLILGWSVLSLLFWTHGKSHSLPWDRDDGAEVRLAKAGLDVTYGALPLLAVFVIEAGGLTPGSVETPAVLLGAGIATLAYVAMYALLIRARMARYRVDLRREG